ncbi:MAG: YkgJ family cysteine cluster protein [Candidatus Omnitrophica bacterium]|nr:YkgJ family cysteine cluster protein [Candidatus Omnitrophota bacterium]
MKIKLSQDPCRDCGYCCTYLAMEIDRPRSASDFDDIRWYLIHRGVHVYVCPENVWHIQFAAPCLHLKNGRCKIYHKRPAICRGYEVHNCSRHAAEPDEKHSFKKEADLKRYLKKHRPRVYRKMYPDL